MSFPETRCKVCLNLASKEASDFPKRNSNYGSFFVRDIFILARSASNGCGGCSLLSKGITYFIPDLNSIREVCVVMSESDEPLTVLVYRDVDKDINGQ